MPEAPDPEGLPDWEDQRAKLLNDPSARRADSAVEVRLCDEMALEADAKREARQRNWLRVRGALPEDPLIHTAMLVYASDRTLLSTAARPHGLPWGKRMAASLDHALWIHRPVRIEGWLLYASESPVARAARTASRRRNAATWLVGTGRIELPASAVSRRRSTTELRAKPSVRTRIQ